MDWIVDGVALGGWYDATNHKMLRDERIEAVLQLHNPGEPDEFPSEFAILQFGIRDGRPIPLEYLRHGAAFVRSHLAEGRRVLIACGAGASRSVTFTMAYLHEEGMSLEEAVALIVAIRKRALPHPDLLRSLIHCYQAPTTAEALYAAILHQKRKQRLAAEASGNW